MADLKSIKRNIAERLVAAFIANELRLHIHEAIPATIDSSKLDEIIKAGVAYAGTVGFTDIPGVVGVAESAVEAAFPEAISIVASSDVPDVHRYLQPAFLNDELLERVRRRQLR